MEVNDLGSTRGFSPVPNEGIFSVERIAVPENEALEAAHDANGGTRMFVSKNFRRGDTNARLRTSLVLGVRSSVVEVLWIFEDSHFKSFIEVQDA